MAIVDGVYVVVEMLTDCGEVAGAARIQHRTPILRLRAPSTPSELVIPGLEMN